MRIDISFEEYTYNEQKTTSIILIKMLVCKLIFKCMCVCSVQCTHIIALIFIQCEILKMKIYTLIAKKSELIIICAQHSIFVFVHFKWIFVIQSISNWFLLYFLTIKKLIILFSTFIATEPNAFSVFHS